MTPHADTLIEGALVVHPGPPASVERLGVAIAGDAIAAVDQEQALGRRFPSAERLDATGRLLMPGLVNAHLHPELHLLKGLLEGRGLHDWGGFLPLERSLAALSAGDGRALQRAAIRAAFADAVLGGSTYVGAYGVTEGADLIAAEELEALGLRGHVTVRDVDFAPAAGLPTPHAYRLHAEEALTEGELAAAAAAHARGEWIVMHAAETRWRRQLARRRFGLSTIRLLQRHGLLSGRVLLSHAVHVDPEERDIIASSGALVIASPTAEMKLSDGVAPVRDYVAGGVPLLLGTDAAVCNNGNDMFLEMRQLGLVQKLRYGAGELGAERILLSGTGGGVALPGAPPGWGRIAAGSPADLILVGTHNPRLQPLLHGPLFSNITANLVYAATGQDVTDVMIGGRWVVREGQLVPADAEEIWDALSAASRTLDQRRW